MLRLIPPRAASILRQNLTPNARPTPRSSRVETPQMKSTSFQARHRAYAFVAIVLFFAAFSFNSHSSAQQRAGRPTRPGKAEAAPVLTITPMTWGVAGLDSNNVTVGPNVFPVSA